MSSIFPLCHGVMCGEAALACSPSPIQPCVCKALFNGPDCTGHYFTDNTAAFWALNSLTFLAFLGLFVFAVFLLLFWFTRLVPVTAATVRSPTSQAKNPQLYGVFLMAIGTLLRIVYGIVMLAGSPTIEFDYYINASFVQWLARFTYGFFYPLVFASFSLQVLLWIDLLLRNKRMQLVGSSSLWMWWVFLGWCLLLVVLELVIEGLLIANYNAVNVVRAYRGILCIFLFVLLVCVGTFGVRFLYLMYKSAPAAGHVEKRRQGRKNLTRLVLSSGCILLGTLVLTLYITVKPPLNSGSYFVVMFLLRLCDCGAVLLVEFTFWTMMRSRVEQLELHSAQGKLPVVDIKSDRDEQLDTPLMGSILDDGDLSVEGLLQEDLEMN